MSPRGLRDEVLPGEAPCFPTWAKQARCRKHFCGFTPRGFGLESLQKRCYNCTEWQIMVDTLSSGTIFS